jgi:hypothetical protein
MNELVNGFRCVECGDVFFRMPEWGYCDNSIECAGSDGDSLQPYSYDPSVY